MPSLTDHPSLRLIKGLILGDPGSGKTGSLTPLVGAGYSLRVYDFDNLLGSLVQYLYKDFPQLVGNVSYQTFTDKMRGVDNPVQMVGNAMRVVPFVDGVPTAFSRATKQLNHWRTDTEDLGRPAEWGSKVIVVIDSLTSLANSAFRYIQAMNPAAKEPQTHYFAAQNLLENMLALLCSEQFNTNVLVLAHIYYDKNQLQITRGFPRSIGSALNEKIGAYFNCVLQVECTGSSRHILTNSTGIVDLKNPVSFKVPQKLPIETGLADFFAAVLSPKKNPTETKGTS